MARTSSILRSENTPSRRAPGNGRSRARVPVAMNSVSYAASPSAKCTRLAARSMDYFHLYAFNVLRQLGANFELLGSHVRWLIEQHEIELDDVVKACTQLAEGAKALQFQLARAVSRKKFGDYRSLLDELEGAHELVLGTLERRYG